MCGIVGYLGPQNPKDIILQGLKKLEYRGYDSAGVAILDHGIFKRVRAEGKLVNLEKKLVDEKFEGHLGIGHTRWATHGVPSERNAHPHQVDGISLVHNGIIENYLEIREDLLKMGALLTSETDSELVAHLVALEIKKTKDLFLAVKSILLRLRGAFSIVVIWDQKPKEMIAFKDGPPLIVGLGPEETFIVSDVQAAIAHTSEFVYLEDREVVWIQNKEVRFFDDQGNEVKKAPVHVAWSEDQMDKMGFPHYMLKEIYEQPRAIAHAIKETFQIPADFESQFDQVQKITIVACGTSYYAALMGKYYFEKLARIPCEVDVASEFRYRNPLIKKNDLVIAISQSGETADTLSAARLGKSKGALLLSICNVKNSSLDRESHIQMYMNSGIEVGVASTKAFTCSLALLNVLALRLGLYRNQIQKPEFKEQEEALKALPSQVEAILSYDKYFLEASDAFKEFKGFLYMGRGVSYPIAMEGALKMKELAYLHAEGYPAGEMKHGPLALVDANIAVVMILPLDEHFEKSLSNLEEAKARGGKIISLSTGHQPKLKKISDRYLSLPKAHWSTNPILSVIPLQLMAYHLADSLGHDVDQPRNLAKSVTVE